MFSSFESRDTCLKAISGWVSWSRVLESLKDAYMTTKSHKHLFTTVLRADRLRWLCAANGIKLTRWTAGASCLKVVAIEIGGTTALEFHCSGSWPAWIAKVPKCGKGSSVFCPDSFAILEEEERKVRAKQWRSTRNSGTHWTLGAAISPCPSLCATYYSQRFWIAKEKLKTILMMVASNRRSFLRWEKHDKQGQNTDSHLPQTLPLVLKCPRAYRVPRVSEQTRVDWKGNLQTHHQPPILRLQDMAASISANWRRDKKDESIFPKSLPERKKWLHLWMEERTRKHLCRRDSHTFARGLG